MPAVRRAWTVDDIRDWSPWRQLDMLAYLEGWSSRDLGECVQLSPWEQTMLSICKGRTEKTVAGILSDMECDELRRHVVEQLLFPLTDDRRWSRDERAIDAKLTPLGLGLAAMGEALAKAAS